MDYYDILRKKAKKGLKAVLDYIDNNNDLIYDKKEVDDVIEVYIESRIEKYEWDYLMGMEFNLEGEFLQEF